MCKHSLLDENYSHLIKGIGGGGKIDGDVKCVYPMNNNDLGFLK